ncbi:MAG TPA: hypothetical protein VGR84_18915 [Candidatus Acidoferrales bacterium]|nr:hypothetical protein [Candidatus Acidoferrales bacterium]
MSQISPTAQIGPLTSFLPPPQIGAAPAAAPNLQLNVPTPPAPKPDQDQATGGGIPYGASPIPDYERPLFDRISGRESGGRDVLYGGAPTPPGNVIPGAIGPTGQQTHAFNEFQMQPDTWNAAAAAARAQGRVLNHNNKADVEWAAHYTAEKAFKAKTGLDLDAEAKKASESGDWSKIDGALASTWPTLGGPRNGLMGPDAITVGMTEGFKQQQELDRAHLAEMHDQMKQIQKLMSETDPDGPEMRKLLRKQIDIGQDIEAKYLEMSKHPPTQTMPQLFSVFGGLAMLVAAIGGRHSRQPATASLNAAAGVIQGIEQNNQQQFDNSFKTWKAQTEALQDALTAQNAVFSGILQDEKLSQADRVEKINEAFKIFDMGHQSWQVEHGMLQEAMMAPLQIKTAAQEIEKNTASIRNINNEADRNAAQAANLKQGGAVTQMLDQGTAPPTPYVEDKQGGTWTVKWQTLPDGSVQQIREPYTPTQHGRLPSAQQPMLPPLVYPKEGWPGMAEGKPPPGVREDVWDAALFFARTHQMPQMGFSPAGRQYINQALPAALRALNIPPTQWADYIAQFAGERHGEIVLGGRAATLGAAVNEAEAIMPLALSASERVDRTEYPSLNSVLEGYYRHTGGDDIVQLATFTYALQNVMAQVAARQGASTDLARKRASDTLTEAYSKGQYKAAVDAMMAEAQAALTAPARTQGTMRQTFAPPGAGGGGQGQPGGPAGGGGVVIQNGWRYDAATKQPIGPVQ